MTDSAVTNYRPCSSSFRLLKELPVSACKRSPHSAPRRPVCPTARFWSQFCPSRRLELAFMPLKSTRLMSPGVKVWRKDPELTREAGGEVTPPPSGSWAA